MEILAPRKGSGRRIFSGRAFNWKENGIRRENCIIRNLKQQRFNFIRLQILNDFCSCRKNNGKSPKSKKNRKKNSWSAKKQESLSKKQGKKTFFVNNELNHLNFFISVFRSFGTCYFFFLGASPAGLSAFFLGPKNIFVGFECFWESLFCSGFW